MMNDREKSHSAHSSWEADEQRIDPRQLSLRANFFAEVPELAGH
jgi:hypothetical protein